MNNGITFDEINFSPETVENPGGFCYNEGQKREGMLAPYKKLFDRMDGAKK